MTVWISIPQRMVGPLNPLPSLWLVQYYMLYQVITPGLSSSMQWLHHSPETVFTGPLCFHLLFHHLSWVEGMKLCAISGWAFSCHLFSALWLVLSLWNYHCPLQKESSLAKTGPIYRHKHYYLQCIWWAHCVHLAKQATDFPLELMLSPAGHLWLGFQYQMWIPFCAVLVKFNEVIGFPIPESPILHRLTHLSYTVSSIRNRQGLLSDCCWQFLPLAVCRTVLFYMLC